MIELLPSVPEDHLKLDSLNLGIHIHARGWPVVLDDTGPDINIIETAVKKVGDCLPNEFLVWVTSELVGGDFFTGIRGANSHGIRGVR